MAQQHLAVPMQQAMGGPTQGNSTQDDGKWGSGMIVNMEETMNYNGHDFMWYVSMHFVAQN